MTPTQSDIDEINTLIDLCLSIQSLTYDFFRRVLQIKDSDIRRIEITYFSAAVITYIYFRNKNASSRNASENIKYLKIDTFTLRILRESIPSCNEKISENEAIIKYRQRYAEYDSLIPILFQKQEPPPQTTIMLHVFECISKLSAEKYMIQLSLNSNFVWDIFNACHEVIEVNLKEKSNQILEKHLTLSNYVSNEKFEQLMKEDSWLSRLKVWSKRL